MNPLSTSGASNLLDKKIRKVYIKDGERRIRTSDGYMKIKQDISRRLFGKLRGGKYSFLQD